MRTREPASAAAPVLLVGLGKIGYSILLMLRDLGIPAVVITRGVPSDWQARAEKFAARLIRSDGRSDNVLLEAGIESARALIIATNDDLVNLEILLDAQRLAPHVPAVVRMLDPGLAERIKRDFPVRAALNAADISAPAFVAAALGADLLRAFEVEGMSLHVSSKKHAGDPRPVREIAQREGKLVVAVRNSDCDYQVLPPEDAFIQSGSEVVFVDIHKSERRRHQGSRRSSLRSEPWIRPRITPLDFFWGAIKHGAGPLRWLFGGLVGVVALSSWIFHSTMGLAWIDALYFTITTITTVGFGDIHFSNAPAWVKLYGCGLMLTGVSMLVLLYGLFTDYLVRMRVEEAVGPKRTTLEGHVIVAGTGDLGAQIAARLHAMGTPLLAIEREADSPSAQMLPSDVPVLHGDATLRSTLERAGVGQARAVVAVTDDDMTNLRIAQRTEESNRKARTVVRLFQSLLAAKMGTSLLGADIPLNPSEAAAASYIASALMPDVLHAFTLGPHLLVVRRVSAEDVGVLEPMPASDIRERYRAIALLRAEPGGERLLPLAEDQMIEPSDTLVWMDEYRSGSA